MGDLCEQRAHFVTAPKSERKSARAIPERFYPWNCVTREHKFLESAGLAGAGQSRHPSRDHAPKQAAAAAVDEPLARDGPRAPPNRAINAAASRRTPRVVRRGGAIAAVKVVPRRAAKAAGPGPRGIHSRFERRRPGKARRGSAAQRLDWSRGPSAGACGWGHSAYPTTRARQL